MRGESMKDKSKKSTYSTTFGIDPKIPSPRFAHRKNKKAALSSDLKPSGSNAGLNIASLALRAFDTCQKFHLRVSHIGKTKKAALSSGLKPSGSNAGLNIASLALRVFGTCQKFHLRVSHIGKTKKAALSSGLKPSGVPTGIRTPVLGMKIQCPRPG